MTAFVYRALPVRVVFGAGSVAQLPDEAAALGLRNVLVLSTAGRSAAAHSVAEALGDCVAAVHAGAVMHVPAEVAEQARDIAVRHGADGCIAIGGGSAIGLGKALALDLGLPLIAVPTTYSGSEMTSIWGVTEGDEKRTGRDDRALPRTVVYDPRLTVSLPTKVSVTSAMNAIAHAAESLYAPDTSPVVTLMAEAGIRRLANALPEVVAHPDDIDARTEALCGAWLCGICLGATTMSLHHKLCHVLGGSFGLPHAETHTVVLPHVLAYNTVAAPEAMAVLGRALRTDSPAQALFDLTRRLGATQSLAELGLGENDLDHAVALATRQPYANPRPVTRDGIHRLLRAALAGTPPDVPSAEPGADAPSRKSPAAPPC